MKDAVANAKIGDPGKYQEEIKKAQRATNQMVFDRAKALGMSDEDAKKIADNASDYVGNFYYTAMAYDLRQGAESDECDSACWDRRDAEFNRWLDNEFKERDLRIFNEDHNWDISEGGTFIPDERAINNYLTGVLTTDASAALQEAADEAFAAANKAKKTKEDYENKKGIADDLLAKANSFADQSSAEAQAAHAKARTALDEAKKALNFKEAIIGINKPHDATMGAKIKLILSPTPPVECLSQTNSSSKILDQSIVSPEAVIASVKLTVSSGVIPLEKIAILIAAI